MEILDYKDLLVKLKDLKRTGKRIGEFYTTGKIHKGHLSGIKYAKENSDVSVVLFSYYRPKVYFQMTGRMISDYRSNMHDDLKILEHSGLVDYVSIIDYDRKIFDEVASCRNLVISELDRLKEFDWFRKLSRGGEALNNLITSLSFSLRVSPEEPLCDSNWYSDKHLLAYLADKLAKKYKIPVKFNFYPVVRENGIALESRHEGSSEDVLNSRKKAGALLNEIVSRISQTGNVFEVPGVIVDLINIDTLQSEDRIKSGKSYLLHLYYFNSKDYIELFDVRRISSDGEIF